METTAPIWIGLSCLVKVILKVAGFTKLHLFSVFSLQIYFPHFNLENVPVVPSL